MQRIERVVESLFPQTPTFVLLHDFIADAPDGDHERRRIR